MKGRALFVVSAFVAGAAAAPAFAAGTNEKNPDSYATGMTGTGSNAMDPNANDSRVVVVPGTTYVTPAPGAVVGNIIAPSGTVAYTTQPATVVYPYQVYNPSGVAVNHGAVGGQSAGKSSDSPGS